MRVVMGCALAAVLCASVGLSSRVSADDKKGDAIDPKKLLGKWEGKDQKPPFTIEFLADGKAVLGTDSKKQPKVDATYKLNGNKLAMVVKIGGVEQKMVRTISKLTDAELVSTDEQGTEDKLTRVKGKDK